MAESITFDAGLLTGVLLTNAVGGALWLAGPGAYAGTNAAFHTIMIAEIPMSLALAVALIIRRRPRPSVRHAP